jgi:hypothetical protein
VSLSAWSEGLQRAGSNYKPSGQIVVAGWTDKLPSPVKVPGAGTVTKGRTAVVVRALVSSTGERLSDTSTLQQLVRGPAAFPNNQQNTIQAVYALTLPTTVNGNRPVDLSRLMMHLPTLFQKTELWTPSGWVTQPRGSGGADELPVPPAAVIHGTVYIRQVIPVDKAPGPGRQLSFYEAEQR